MSAPDTPAIRAATALGLAYELRQIERPNSLEDAAAKLGVAPQHLLKTLVVRRAEDDHLLVVVPGDRRLDWPRLRAHLGVSRVSLPDADEARAVTGYERGTITPFGTRVALPVLIDASVVGTGTVTIGAGAHGWSFRVDADALVATLSEQLDAQVVAVT